MKPPRLLTLLATAASVFFACVSAYFALEFRFAVGILGKPTFTVDQVLAALTVSIAVLTVVVAIVAIGIGFAAVFGFTEMRTITYRKTEEQLRQVIENMTNTGELSAATAMVLKESAKFDVVKAARLHESKGSSAPSKTEEVSHEGTSQTEQVAKEYPKK